MASLWNITSRTTLRTVRNIRFSPGPLRVTGVRPFSASYALGNIVRSPFPDVQQPPGNLCHAVFENSHRWGSKIAIECADTGHSYTYNQLLNGITKWAGFLTRLELQKGDMIAINMPNCPEYPIVFFGAISLGIGVSTVNHNYTGEEVARQLTDSGAKLLVGDPSVEVPIKSAIPLYKRPLHLIMNGPSTLQGALNLHEILKDPTVPHADPIELTGRELAAMPYSSGTTGVPKGVALSHNAISICLRMFTIPAVFTTGKTTSNHQDSYLCVLPFYHVYAMFILMTVGLHAGVKIVAMTKFDPAQFLGSIVKDKVECLHLVPPMLNFLIHSPDATREKLASVRSMLIGAAPVSVASAEAFKDKINKEVFFQEGYGMTELMISNVNVIGEERIGFCGKLLPNVSAKIIDTDTGEDLPPTKKGEICMKSPALMSGYYHNEAATSATIDQDGWLHTGDVGFFDADGFLKIVDRTKELIKVKGLQVSPSELENVLRQHPQVVDVGVVGVPHDRQGEAPRAYIITKSQITEEDIHKFLEPKVAPHKKLVGGLAFVKELPKNATGKLLRRELKKMALEKFKMLVL